MKYIALIKPSGEITAEPVSKSNLLADIQRFVGGSIQICPQQSTAMIDKSLVLIVNEEGKLNNLPYNPVATAVYGHPRDHITGNAVIMRVVPDDIAPFDSRARLYELVIEPLKIKLAQMLECHGDE